MGVAAKAGDHPFLLGPYMLAKAAGAEQIAVMQYLHTFELVQNVYTRFLLGQID